ACVREPNARCQIPKTHVVCEHPVICHPEASLNVAEVLPVKPQPFRAGLNSPRNILRLALYQLATQRGMKIAPPNDLHIVLRIRLEKRQIEVRHECFCMKSPARQRCTSGYMGAGNVRTE